ncbi:MAG: chemotaxis protein CheD, partial [Cyanobacteria bacterium REEB65]|nr:chemotaxis protein CheD [Cyanobacteria bacterium REEB65]
AEWRVSTNQSDVFQAPGLGSCVGVAIYDPVAQVAAMAHVMLPDSMLNQGEEAQKGPQPAKFADTAVPLLKKALLDKGADPKRLVAKVAGGAKMFRTRGPGLALGTRNAEAILKALEQSGIPAVATDLGGTCGRTVRFHVSSFCLEVRSAGQPIQEL